MHFMSSSSNRRERARKIIRSNLARVFWRIFFFLFLVLVLPIVCFDKLFTGNNQGHQQSPILRHISSPSLQTSAVVLHQQFVQNNNNNCQTLSNHLTSPMSMESSTIVLPSEVNFNRSSYGRNRIRKKQPRTNPNYVNIEIKSNDGSLRSTYIRIHDVQKSQTSTLSSSSSSSSNSSSSSSSSTKNPPVEQDSTAVCNAHFHSQNYLTDNHDYFASNDTIHSTSESTTTTTTPSKKTSSWMTTNEQRNELLMQQQTTDQHSSNDEPQTLTNKTAQLMKQFVSCNEGTRVEYTRKRARNSVVFRLEFVFHSGADPLSLNLNQFKPIAHHHHHHHHHHGRTCVDLSSRCVSMTMH
jgi:hypothetical protein